MRKGMMLGKGRGYKNVIGTDPRVHGQSARGIKQPQRMPYMSINPAMAKYSNVKLQEGAVKEHIEHPKFSFAQAREIAKDHLTENPRAYGKWQYGDREFKHPLNLEDSQIANFRKIALKKDIDPVLFEEFMMRAFPDATCGYDEEWADRFRKGNPMKYMDSHTLKIYKEVLKDYEGKYFSKGGKCGGKFSVTSKNALTFKDKNGVLITVDSPEDFDGWESKEQDQYINKIAQKNDATFVSDNIKASLRGGKQPKEEWVIESKKFRNKKTGEIVTQVPILDINDYEEVKGGKISDKNVLAMAYKWDRVLVKHKHKTAPNQFSKKTLNNYEKLGYLEKSREGEYWLTKRGITFLRDTEKPRDMINMMGGKHAIRRAINKTGRGYVKAVDYVKKEIKGGKTAKQTMKEFEDMRNLAELKALSSTSLRRELTDKEFARMQYLFKEVKGGKSYNLKIDAQIDKKKYKGDVKLKLPDNGAFGGKMSAKDYEAFAKIMGSSRNLGEADARIAFYMQQDNPKFDRVRYINATKEWDRKAKGGKN